MGEGAWGAAPTQGCLSTHDQALTASHTAVPSEWCPTLPCPLTRAGLCIGISERPPQPMEQGLLHYFTHSLLQ